MVGYVMLAPPFTHASAGVRALYILADELRARGYPVRMVDGVNDDLTRVRPGREIVIYPETAPGNMLNASRVVRWTLNTPGHLGGDKAYPDSEWVWTWSKRFCDAPLLTVDTIEHDLFYIDDTPKTIDCSYFGKGQFRSVKHLPLTRHMPEIHRNDPPWPMKREQVGELLRATRTLYTYDDCTALVDEALLCGCRVVLLPEDRELTWHGHVETYLPSRDHAAHIDAFVAATQARWADANVA